MRKAFADAIKNAPSVLFVDEVDTYGSRNSRGYHEAYWTAAITGFLQLVDGFHAREGVVVVAACNHADRLDPAIRRAGRLGRHFEITLPDMQSRLSILKFHSGIELDNSEAEMFAMATDGLSKQDFETIHIGKAYDIELQSEDGTEANAEKLLAA